jgi:hypothetical protein
VRNEQKYNTALPPAGKHYSACAHICWIAYVSKSRERFARSQRSCDRSQWSCDRSHELCIHFTFTFRPNLVNRLGLDVRLLRPDAQPNAQSLCQFLATLEKLVQHFPATKTWHTTTGRVADHNDRSCGRGGGRRMSRKLASCNMLVG